MKIPADDTPPRDAATVPERWHAGDPRRVAVQRRYACERCGLPRGPHACVARTSAARPAPPAVAKRCEHGGDRTYRDRAGYPCCFDCSLAAGMGSDWEMT